MSRIVTRVGRTLVQFGIAVSVVGSLSAAAVAAPDTNEFDARQIQVPSHRLVEAREAFGKLAVNVTFQGPAPATSGGPDIRQLDRRA
jgi:hypothetical protein